MFPIDSTGLCPVESRALNRRCKRGCAGRSRPYQLGSTGRSSQLAPLCSLAQTIPHKLPPPTPVGLESTGLRFVHKLSLALPCATATATWACLCWPCPCGPAGSQGRQRCGPLLAVAEGGGKSLKGGIRCWKPACAHRGVAMMAAAALGASWWQAMFSQLSVHHPLTPGLLDDSHSHQPLPFKFWAHSQGPPPKRDRPTPAHPQTGGGQGLFGAALLGARRRGREWWYELGSG